VPGFDLPVARLRSARIRLRPRQKGWVGVTPGGGLTLTSIDAGELSLCGSVGRHWE
jgi:hypothetical protein